MFFSPSFPSPNQTKTFFFQFLFHFFSASKIKIRNIFATYKPKKRREREKWMPRGERIVFFNIQKKQELVFVFDAFPLLSSTKINTKKAIYPKEVPRTSLSGGIVHLLLSSALPGTEACCKE